MLAQAHAQRVVEVLQGSVAIPPTIALHALPSFRRIKQAALNETAVSAEPTPASDSGDHRFRGDTSSKHTLDHNRYWGRGSHRSDLRAAEWTISVIADACKTHGIGVHPKKDRFDGTEWHAQLGLMVVLFFAFARTAVFVLKC